MSNDPLDIFSVSTEWLDFVERKPKKPIKTRIITITSNSSGLKLGEIKWYGPWRQYCVFLTEQTIFNTSCLDAIQEVLDNLARMRQEEKAKK